MLIALALLVLAATATPSLAQVYNLRAAALSVTMPDGTVVAMWGFAQDAGPVTVPGPLLEVPANDSVLTINLTNQLPEPVSVIIPGQGATFAPVRFTDAQGRQRVRSFTAETAPGATRAYTWTGLKPGTFLYQSGTHPAVQVQMGLYGAVKKNQAAGLAYPGVAYDSELVLLFSEIDPALHQAVATNNYGPGKGVTSTLDYRPKYFLINGEPYSDAQTPLPGVNLGEQVT
jgi:FtsP/CotA-like multicopper oxidase with cupredoxin domain